MSQLNQKIVDIDGVKFFLDSKKAILANLLVPVQKCIIGSVYLLKTETVTPENYRDKIFIMSLVDYDEMTLVNLFGHRYTNPIKVPSHRPTEEQWGILTSHNANFVQIIDLRAFLMEIFGAPESV